MSSERLIRAGGNPYMLVRPGWFDYNQPDQRTIVMLQGDRRQSGSPADGVIARDQIARVLIDSHHIGAADHKTLELVADHGPDQDDLPTENEPEVLRDDLATITAGSLKAGG
ncbi:hypothetical protein [Arthrobacter sp. UYCu712]|uniref:hypothetical protein n=1 Tax=Arthrobacter sp. UYCu712 TaxID=3156340 RepID=UPI003394CF7E